MSLSKRTMILSLMSFAASAIYFAKTAYAVDQSTSKRTPAAAASAKKKNARAPAKAASAAKRNASRATTAPVPATAKTGVISAKPATAPAAATPAPALTFPAAGTENADPLATPSGSSAATSGTAGGRRIKSGRSTSHSEIGFGYTLWNERLSVARAGVKQDGYAGFGGYHATIERNWVKLRWQWGGSAGFGIGKVSAGGVSGAFPEGRDRPWYTATIQPFFHYRVNSNFMTGFGAFVRYRGVDWTSIDPSTQIDNTGKMQASIQLNLRWSLNRWTLIQSIAPLDFVGDTVWTWTAQYVL